MQSSRGSKGYVLMARAIDDSPVSKFTPCTREIWAYLIRNANHSRGNFRGLVLERGQLFRSYMEIRKALSWRVGYRIESYDEESVKRCMRTLRHNEMITTTKKLGGVIITICNYDFYQSKESYGNTLENSLCDTSIDLAAPHENPNNNNKKNNTKNTNNIITLGSMGGNEAITQLTDIGYRLRRFVMKDRNVQVTDYELGKWLGQIQALASTDGVSFQRMSVAIEILEENSDSEYCPQIKNGWEFRRKLTDIEAFYRRQNCEKKDEPWNVK